MVVVVVAIEGARNTAIVSRWIGQGGEAALLDRVPDSAWQAAQRTGGRTSLDGRNTLAELPVRSAGFDPIAARLAAISARIRRRTCGD